MDSELQVKGTGRNTVTGENRSSKFEASVPRIELSYFLFLFFSFFLFL